LYKLASFSRKSRDGVFFFAAKQELSLGRALIATTFGFAAKKKTPSLLLRLKKYFHFLTSNSHCPHLINIF